MGLGIVWYSNPIFLPIKFYIKLYICLLFCMKINIKGKEVELKYTFRSFILYENIQGKSFTPSTTTEVLIFLYCCILASDRELVFTFDEFLDYVDEHPNVIEEFSEFFVAQINQNQSLNPSEEKEYDMDGNEIESKKN